MASSLSPLSSPSSPRRPAAWTVSLLLLLLLPLEVLSQDLDLADALGDDDNPPLTLAPRPAIPEGDIGLDFDDTPKVVETTTTTTTKPPPKAPPKAPAAPKGTVKPKPKPGGAAGGDSDQIDQYDDRSGETTAEIGTIAGIVSAVAMALVGAISSYISYQKKKLCFGLQQSLNTDMVKAENPEAVVATEPQVQQTLLEPPNAEPPTEENAV